MNFFALGILNSFDVLVIAGVCFGTWVVADQLLWSARQWSRFLAVAIGQITSQSPVARATVSPVVGHDVAPDHGPQHPSSSNAQDLSSPPPARCTPRSTRGASLAVAPFLADITSTPDHQAFTAGVEAGVFVIVVAIGAIAVFGLFRWALSRISNGE